jgi:ketosteroid isomerase-like protein
VIRSLVSFDTKEDLMGEARRVMDEVTEAAFSGDASRFGACYAEGSTATTPDAGELRGRDEIVAWMQQFNEAMPDLRWEEIAKHEDGDTAIDEGYVVGTNTGPLPMPGGETLSPTGKQIRIRGCDVATVRDGLIVSHRFYYDQMEFLSQLGLVPEESAATA